MIAYALFYRHGIPMAIFCPKHCKTLYNLFQIGILGNSLSIPVLLSRAMDSVFNRLLVYLAVFDNVYVILSLCDCFRKHLGTILLHQVQMVPL